MGLRQSKKSDVEKALDLVQQDPYFIEEYSVTSIEEAWRPLNSFFRQKNIPMFTITWKPIQPQLKRSILDLPKIDSAGNTIWSNYFLRRILEIVQYEEGYFSDVMELAWCIGRYKKIASVNTWYKFYNININMFVYPADFGFLSGFVTSDFIKKLEKIMRKRDRSFNILGMLPLKNYKFTDENPALINREIR